MRKVSVLERNYCPLSSGMSVRFKTESLSVFIRNHCPLCSGMGVRFAPDFAIKSQKWIEQVKSPERADINVQDVVI